ncbi:STAS domain-containing protein [Nocardiopsis sp. NPDC050513]|uniref:STAS domain-containing protein n=1 Tax=Nocardiopsis sp. NPDC050513 TaxID=3364338 RepID=UPI0037A28E00
MKIDKRASDGVSILDLSGRLVIGNGGVELRESVRDLLETGENRVLLNMEAVSSIDSSGVGELVSAYTTASNQGGQLKLLNLPPQLHDVLVITRLASVFEIHDDEAEAVDSFS